MINNVNVNTLIVYFVLVCVRSEICTIQLKKYILRSLKEKIFLWFRSNSSWTTILQISINVTYCIKFLKPWEKFTHNFYSPKNPKKCLYIILLLLKTIFVKHFSTKMSFFVKKWDQPIINCKSKIIIFRFHTFSFCLLVCNVSFILSSQQLFYSVSVVL